MRGSLQAWCLVHGFAFGFFQVDLMFVPGDLVLSCKVLLWFLLLVLLWSSLQVG